jgi:hypothetical protein
MYCEGELFDKDKKVEVILFILVAFIRTYGLAETTFLNFYKIF